MKTIWLSIFLLIFGFLLIIIGFNIYGNSNYWVQQINRTGIRPATPLTYLGIFVILIGMVMIALGLVDV